MRARDTWSVHYTSRELPQLEELPRFLQSAPRDPEPWLDDAGIPDGVPFLLSPRFEYDVELNAYWLRPELIEAPLNSNANRARALASFFTFLWRARGQKGWRDAVEADHLTYRHWRRRDMKGPRVEGRTWNAEVSHDDRRLQRILKRHDPAIYPGEFITCVHDHPKALCEKARRGRSEQLPDHGGCKPLACRNVTLSRANIDAWLRVVDRIDRRLAALPALPPLRERMLRARRQEIVDFLHANTPEGTIS